MRRRTIQVILVGIVLAFLVWGLNGVGFSTTTVAEALDRNGNGNCIIDDPEINQAVEYWITGKPLPGTTLTIGDAQILELVRLWIGGENVCSTAEGGAPQVLSLDISPNPALTSDSEHDVYNYFDLIIKFTDPQQDVHQALIHMTWPDGSTSDYTEPVTAQDNSDGAYRSTGYWLDFPGTISFTVVLVDAEGHRSQPFTRSFAVVTPEGTTPPTAVDTAFLALINRYRTQSNQCWDSLTQAWRPWPAAAQRELTLSDALSRAASYHSQFMADHDCFAHQCPGEPDMVARIEQAGYTNWWILAENIAAGMETPQEAFNAWKNSPGHNKNMLNCYVSEIGVGRVYDGQDRYPSPGAPYRWYWTTDFASR